MSTVDDRVVAMHFDNKEFESNAGRTLSTLDKLKNALNFGNASKSLNDISAASRGFSLNPLTSATQGVSKAFLAMSTIAVTALATITSKAVDAGLSMVKSLSLDPVIAGYREYATNLNSIQTILSNTKASGATLDDVNAALAKLNKYSDQTIYNFSEMAKNIGTFTAAGVDLDTSVNSIKGIANLAALSGSNSQQASTAMYQLSQAIAAGRVSLQDWNSVVNAGMGGATFQRALAQTAVAMGEIDKNSVKLTGSMKNVSINGKSFRESIMAKPGEVSWLSSKVLTNTLQQFTGDLSHAELAAQGFNDAQIKAIQATAKNAQDAATKVKTLSQLIDVAKETAGSGWAKTWQIVFGDFKEARKSFTNASNAVNGLLNNMANARNKILKDWKALGGRNVLIEGIKQAFESLGKILKPIGNAFRDIFPPATGQTLFNLTVQFKQLMQALEPSGQTMENLRSIFRGLFSILDIGWQVIKAVASAIGDLFGVVGGGQGSILGFLANIGDLVYNFDQMLKKKGVIQGFFSGLASVLAVPIELIKVLAGLLVDLFSGGASDAVEAGAQRIQDRFGPLGDALERLMDIWGGFGRFLESAGEFFAPFIAGVGDAFGAIGDAIQDAFGESDFNGILDAINTGLLGGITLLIARWMKKGLSLDLGGGVFENIRKSFEQLTGTLKAMETNIKADTLMKIAAAVGILTLSIVALSLINSEDLTKALLAISVGFAQLLVSMKLLEGIGTSKGFLKIPFIAGSMILLAGAMLLLSGAIAILGNLKLETLAKGIGAVGAVLVVLAGAMRLMPTNMTMQALSLVLVGAALNEIASAIAIMGNLEWKTIAKGIVGVAGALLVIAAAMTVMPPNMTMQAAALILVGGALNIIGAAIALMGNLGWDVIGKGLVTIGASLLILAAGLALMNGSLAGSAALLVAAGALAILTPVLVALGNLSWEAIAKGMVTLAGTFIILGAAGLLLTPLIPSLLGLAAAVALLGAGLALAGAGALAFATAFGIFVAAGTAGIGVLIGIFSTIPVLAKKLAEGVLQFATSIAKNAKAFAVAAGKLVEALIDELTTLVPKAGKLITTVIQTILTVLRQNFGPILDTGYQLLLQLLHGIEDNIGEIVDTVTNIIVKFLDALGRNLPKIIDAGYRLLINFINGITKAVNEHSSELTDAGWDLAEAIIQGMVNGIGQGLGRIKDAAISVAKSALDAAKGVLGIHSPSKEFHKIGVFAAQGFAEGLKSGSVDVVKSVISDMNDRLKELLDAARADIKEYQDELKGLREAQRDDRKDLEKLENKKNKSKEDIKDIKDLKEAIAERNKEIGKYVKKLEDAKVREDLAAAARKKLNKDLADERAQLLGLAGQYEYLAGKIDEATQALNDAIAARDAEAQSVTDQYNQLPDISKETKLADYLEQVKKETAETQAYFAKLQQLRAQGLSDEAYRKLVNEGVEAMPLVDEIIAGGEASIAEFNSTTDALSAAASQMGNTVADSLHNAGIQAAQGLVAGLQSQQDLIQEQMDQIAKAMVKAIKKALKIKSPSRAFEEIGELSVDGLVGGLKQTRGVEKASADLGQTALDTLQATLSKAGTDISDKVSLDPTIRPVLDLTQLEKDASRIDGLLRTTPISPDVSYSQAATISNDRATQAALDQLKTMPVEQKIEYNQTIQSPKALSEIEIYRDTKSLLSLTKEALEI